MKTLILCRDIDQNNRHLKMKGKVGGGLWDLYLVNARAGYCAVFLIDAKNVAEAKVFADQARPTNIPNVYVYGTEAINALQGQGGKTLG